MLTSGSHAFRAAVVGQSLAQLARPTMHCCTVRLGAFHRAICTVARLTRLRAPLRVVLCSYRQEFQNIITLSHPSPFTRVKFEKDTENFEISTENCKRHKPPMPGKSKLMCCRVRSVDRTIPSEVPDVPDAKHLG